LIYYINNEQSKKFKFLVTAAMLKEGRGCRAQFWKGAVQGPSQPNLVQ